MATLHTLTRFRAAPSDHWRKNTPILGQRFKTYAIDLLGYGFSDKPNPRLAQPNSIYNFENWGDQLTDFIEEVIGEPAYISTNSVGGEAHPGGRERGGEGGGGRGRGREGGRC